MTPGAKENLEAFPDDGVEPTQWLIPSLWTKPEQKLMWAVLDDCLRLLRRSRDPNARHEVYRWLHSNEDDYLFSLISICTELELDPVVVRRYADSITYVPGGRVDPNSEPLPRYVTFSSQQRPRPYRVQIPMSSARRKYLRKSFHSLREAEVFVTRNHKELKPKRKRRNG